MSEPWTAETVELVARAEYEADCADNQNPIPWGQEVQTVREGYIASAVATLAALHRAGLLLSSSLSHVGWMDPHGFIAWDATRQPPPDYGYSRRVFAEREGTTAVRALLPPEETQT